MQHINSFNYTPPAFLEPKEEKAQSASILYDAEKYPDSSNNLMCLQEVMDTFGVKRGAIISWRHHRNFPNPISSNPQRFLRESINAWQVHVGGFSID